MHFLWCSLILVVGFLAPGITSFGSSPSSSRSTVHNRQAVGDAVAMADKLIAHFNTRVPNSDLASTLVRRLLSIGCDMAIEDSCGSTTADISQSKAFAVDFTSACRTAITDLAITTSSEASQAQQFCSA